jgi:hypothetical protein
VLDGKKWLKQEIMANSKGIRVEHIWMRVDMNK